MSSTFIDGRRYRVANMAAVRKIGPGSADVEVVGDSFTLERHACAAKRCDGFVLFFVDAQSVRPEERARTRCDRCGSVNVLRPDGSTELDPKR